MRADYDSIHTVRLSRRWGWGLASLIGVLVVIMLGWRMLDVAGQRSEAATLENLHAGLNRLALEETAQGRTLHRHWLQANPFAQLRWQADDYCGELVALSQSRAGCWYFWPAQHWVVHRGDEQAGAVEGIRAWRLRAIPERSQQAAETNDSHKAASNGGQSALSNDGLLAVELEQISMGQLQVYLRAEQEE